MMPWRKRQRAAREAAQQARREYEKTCAQRREVEAVAKAINRQGRRNGWMEDLEKIIRSTA
jgi:hypothetical protein